MEVINTAEEIEKIMLLSKVLISTGVIGIACFRYFATNYRMLNKKGIEVDAVITNFTNYRVEYEFELPSRGLITGKGLFKPQFINKLKKQTVIKCLYEENNPQNNKPKRLVTETILVNYLCYFIGSTGIITGVVAYGMGYTF